MDDTATDTVIYTLFCIKNAYNVAYAYWYNISIDTHISLYIVLCANVFHPTVYIYIYIYTYYCICIYAYGMTDDSLFWRVIDYSRINVHSSLIELVICFLVSLFVAYVIWLYGALNILIELYYHCVWRTKLRIDNEYSVIRSILASLLVAMTMCLISFRQNIVN